MIHKKFVKQLIAFHKASFENCFSMMIMLQQQAENIFNFFYYLPFVSDEGKNLMKERTDTYKKCIDNLKKAMDEGYAKIEEFYDNETIDSLKEKTEKMLKSYLPQVSWIPPELKTLLDEMDAIYKRGCDDFKQYVDDNIKNIKNFHDKVHKPKTKTKK